MRERFDINGRELGGQEKEDRVVVSDVCFSCHKKGAIIVRLIDNGVQFSKTQNKINLCKNPECFRYSENVPNNWIYDNQVTPIYDDRNGEDTFSYTRQSGRFFR